MKNVDSVRVAAIQAAPVFLDTESSLEKALELVCDAANTGATLAAFGDGWLPGYPVHCWNSNAPKLWWELAGEYLEQAIEVPGRRTVTDAPCAAAQQVEIDIVVHRRRGRASRRPPVKWPKCTLQKWRSPVPGTRPVRTSSCSGTGRWKTASRPVMVMISRIPVLVRQKKTTNLRADLRSDTATGSADQYCP